MNMTNVLDMSRDQATKYLRTLGEEVHESWTCLEIKFRIGELTETELDRQQGVGAFLRKLRTDREEKGPDEKVVGFGRYADRMYKEVPQPYLDFVMEIAKETPTECSGKLLRLAQWALTQRDSQTGRRPRLLVPVSTEDASMESRRKCQICLVNEAEAGCFFCQARACIHCLRPAPGVPPRCLACAGEAGSAEPRRAEWAQKMEDATKQMISSILQLQKQMIDHETILQQLLRDNPEVAPVEAIEVLEASPSQESPTSVVLSEPADQPPVEDPLGAWAEEPPRSMNCAPATPTRGPGQIQT